MVLALAIGGQTKGSMEDEFGTNLARFPEKL
jgi:hypothetical protein